MAALPVIDVAPLLAALGDTASVAGEIDVACREVGFFRITGHGVAPAQLAELDGLAARSSPDPTRRRRRSPWNGEAGHGAAGSPSTAS